MLYHLTMDHWGGWLVTVVSFDKTERNLEEEPANFGIALETLAVKAFGDIGQTARLRVNSGPVHSWP